ncbi:TonB family protein [Sphingomonas sp. H39-1-10]|uniref:energy transducer TonB n=1 Tax=Sphingomonas pollutisoli TaxID=3030829 RepID=UPI0023B8CFC4|nr:TonB family protein [Sphingomonas pollutisoli]MDF0490371.1 TonB family protein [Sphingomonas pollutisoli]
MSWPSRTNIAGFACSCVVHGAIVGGFLLSVFSVPPRMLAPERSTAPLVVELIPLDRLARSDGEAEPRKREKHRPVLDDRGAGPAIGMRSASVLPREKAAVAVPAMTAAPASSDALAGAQARADISEYQRRLYDLVARNCHYPDGAKRLRLSGVTHMAFRIDRTGKVLESWIQDSSGSDMLDDAALDALARAAPLPPIPAGFPSEMHFVIEIDASLLQQQQQQLADRAGS